MIEGFGVMSAIGLLSTIGAGWLTPNNIETYVSIHGSPYEQDFIAFKEPIGSYGIQTDIHKNVRLFFEHQSSPRMSGDTPGLNHAGVKFLAPLSKDLQKVKKGTLVSLGVESGGTDIKLFSEYIAPTYDLDGGRIAAGVKVLFR